MYALLDRTPRAEANTTLNGRPGDGVITTTFDDDDFNAMIAACYGKPTGRRDNGSETAFAAPGLEYRFATQFGDDGVTDDRPWEKMTCVDGRPSAGIYGSSDLDALTRHEVVEFPSSTQRVLIDA